MSDDGTSAKVWNPGLFRHTLPVNCYGILHGFCTLNLTVLYVVTTFTHLLAVEPFKG